MAKLTIIRGLPGSGKSTQARRIAFQNKAIHLEADMFFMVNGEYKYDASCSREAHTWCQLTAEILLNSGHDVVVSNTFTRMWEMKPYFAIGFPVEVIEAKGEYPSVHNVPQDVLDKMKARWEPYV